MLQNIKFVQKIFIKKAGLFLVLQRSGNDISNPDKWDLPGGNVEQGEDIGNSLLREINEEVGIEVKNIRPKVLASSTLKGTYRIVAIYEADYKSGEVYLSEEHQNYLWISKDKILELNMQPSILGILKEHWEEFN